MRKINLGCDTGIRNWAYSVVEKQGDDFVVLHAGLINNTIDGISGDKYNELRKSFAGDIRYLIKRHKPSLFIAERFQTRGFGGNLIEMIGTMNGIASQIAAANMVNTRLVTAGEWKNQIARKFEKDLLPTMYNYYTPHLLDASLIALYQHEGGFTWLEKNIIKFLYTLRVNTDVLIRE